MSQPIQKKRILSQLGNGVSVLTATTFKALEELSIHSKARLDSLIGVVVFLQLNVELHLSKYDVFHGFTAPTDDVVNAWKALLFNGWITSTDDLIIVHLPSDEASIHSPMATDWLNPLFPLAKAWGVASREVVGAYPLTRLYRLYSEITFVTIPYDLEVVCAFYHAALPTHTFENLVADLSTDQEVIATSAAAWAAKGRPDLAPHVVSADRMVGIWCELKTRSAKKQHFFMLVRAALLGVTPASFERAAIIHKFLDKAIADAEAPSSNGHFAKGFPLNLDALKS